MVLSLWFLRVNTGNRDGVAGALWIAVLWLVLLSSRPLATWMGNDLQVDTLQDALRGSTVDRRAYVLLMLSATVVVLRRNIRWQQLVAANKLLVLFYLYFAVSTLWAEYPLVSMRRLIKDLGSVLIVMIVLSERNRPEALRTLFTRGAWLLVPVSVVLIRYFPAIGRRYHAFSGHLWSIGVTSHKNALGVLLVVVMLPVLWDLLHLKEKRPYRMLANGVLLLLATWLLAAAESATAVACLALGAAVLIAARHASLRPRIVPAAVVAIAAVGVLMGLDSFTSILDPIVSLLGRDATLTGRTDVWQALLALEIPPLIGTGFYSFWSDPNYQEQLPYWIAYSAHNGYIEVYIDGGLIGLGLLLMVLLAVARRIHTQVQSGESTAVLRAAMLLVVLFYNFSESAFGRISPIWFAFLLIAIEYPEAEREGGEEVRELQYPIANKECPIS